jgi:hypothetical protein
MTLAARRTRPIAVTVRRHSRSGAYTAPQAPLACNYPLVRRVHRDMHRLLAASGTSLALVVACSGGSASHVGQSSSYKLYTHCGIREARIGNDYFLAVPPLGNGSPPRGWGNPFQQGTMKRVSETIAVFSDSVGHRVEFHLRRGATAFQRICS